MERLCCKIVDFRRSTHDIIWKNLLNAFHEAVVWSIALTDDVVDCKNESEETKVFLKENVNAMMACRRRVIELHGLMAEGLGYKEKLHQ